MSQEIPEVTSDVLQAFADVWNRHDADALMSFMIEECVFEASAGPEICGALLVVTPCDLVTLKSGPLFPMPTGAMHGTSYKATAGFPSGRSLAQERTVAALK